jgi:hypothetical protein
MFCWFTQRLCAACSADGFFVNSILVLREKLEMEIQGDAFTLQSDSTS